LVLSSDVSAQFGVRMSYSYSSAPNWSALLTEDVNGEATSAVFGSGYSVGLDYWFRFPQKRIEFYPEVSLSQYNKMLERRGLEIQSSMLGLGVNTHFYILNFKGDCDLPTFLKKGNLLKKGLFVSLKPSIIYNKKSIAKEPSEIDITPAMGIGLGLDIGVSNLITLTPFIQYNFHAKENWEELSIHCKGTQAWFPYSCTSSMRQPQLGLRIGFRPDYKQLLNSSI